MSVVSNPPIDPEIMDTVVRRIVETCDPEKIILFGSHACGSPGVHSDLDILVVMNTTLPRYKRAVPVYRVLAGIFIPKDIVVYTPEEIEEWSDVPHAFITTIVRKGRVIYEKKQSRSRP